MTPKILTAACASVLAAWSPVHAQESAPATGAEPPVANQVVVTATKGQPQILVEAPMSIQAFTGRELQAKNIGTIDDLITAIPGASQADQLGEFIRTYSIRGSGTGGGVGDAMIGYYVDDTAYVVPNLQIAPALRLIDIAQVEVLRGPYGTLYGQGAMGGTMIFRTKKPNLEKVTGDVETYVANVEGSSTPSYGAAAALSIPLIPNELAVRISGGKDYRAGYADVYSGDAAGTPRATDANDVRKSDARVVLLWTPNDKLRATVQYLHFGGNQDYSQQMSSVSPAYFANYGNVAGYEKSKNDMYSVSLEYDLGFATLTSATGFTRFDVSYLNGLRLPIVGTGQLYNGYAGNSLTQELRLASTSSGPLHWVGGVYFNRAESNYAYDIDFEVPVLNTIGTTTTGTRNSSVFGEVSYDLFGGQLVPLIGLRHYRDQRRHADTTTTPIVTADEGTVDQSVNTWRANLAWHRNADSTVYFNAGTGFRSGIVQAPIQVAALAADNIKVNQALDPDRMRNLELGAKGTLRSAKLTYEVNLYKQSYTSIQTGLYTSLGLAASASLGNATMRGVDLSLQWQPLPGLNVGVSGDRNWSTYDDVNPLVARGLTGVAPGSRVLNTPRYTARFDVGYTRALQGAWSMYTNASASRSDARLNQDGTETEVFNLFDANIGVRTKSVDIELYGQNLGDARGPWFIRTAGLVAGPTPRTAGLRVRYHF